MTADQPRDEPAVIRAPWTPEQVAALNRFQKSGLMHPFTCGGEHAVGSPRLIARTDGWHCSDPYGEGCDYRQDWAHRFMAEVRTCSGTDGFCDVHGFHRHPPGARPGPDLSDWNSADDASYDQPAPDLPVLPRVWPHVQGRCPACGWGSLFVGEGGYVTCGNLQCPDPCAADTLLDRDVRTATPAPDGDGSGDREPATPRSGEPGGDLNQPDTGSLREGIIAAIRDAARNCNGDCGMTEEDCITAHPVQVSAWTHGVVSDVYGPINDLAAAVAAVRDDEMRELRERLRKAERAVNLLADSHRRAEQAEDLLRIAHDTSNKSEAERALAVQRAEEAEAQLSLIDAMRQNNLDAAGAAIQRAEQAEAALARVSQLAERWRYVQNRREAANSIRTALANPPAGGQGTGAGQAGEAAIVTGTDDDYCGSEPPMRADEPGTQWGDCWCTRLGNHDGDCVCEPCRDRNGAPSWPNPNATTTPKDTTP